MPEKIEITTEAYLKLTSDLIGEAASIAKAAHACAAAGNAQGAYTIALDLDELLFDANNLLQALAVIRRRGLPTP